MIPYFRLKSNYRELEAITLIHKEGTWALGNSINRVKEELRTLFKKEHVVLSSNGYSALFICLKAIGIKNEKVIIPCLSTCFAISDAVIASGNIPVFCDMDLVDGNCDMESVSQLVKEKNCRYIISPNHAGNISDISNFKKLGLVVIEDACQSFFSTLDVKSKADIQVLSFYPTKGINGIDGGAILTDNKNWAKKAEKLVYYNDQTVHENEERYNFRYLNINAAVLLANLTCIKEVQSKLNSIKESYLSSIKNKTNVYFLQNNLVDTAQRMVLYVKDENLKKELVIEFKNKNIVLSPFFEWLCPLNEKEKFKNGNALAKNTFCVPYFEDLTVEEWTSITLSLKNVFA